MKLFKQSGIIQPPPDLFARANQWMMEQLALHQHKYLEAQENRFRKGYKRLTDISKLYNLNQPEITLKLMVDQAEKYEQASTQPIVDTIVGLGDLLQINNPPVLIVSYDDDAVKYTLNGSEVNAAAAETNIRYISKIAKDLENIMKERLDNARMEPGTVPEPEYDVDLDLSPADANHLQKYNIPFDFIPEKINFELMPKIDPKANNGLFVFQNLNIKIFFMLTDNMAANSITTTLYHELIHLVQWLARQAGHNTLKKKLKDNYSDFAGSILPSKSDNADIKDLSIRQHEFRDIEFHTRIADEINKFKTSIAEMPAKMAWKMALGYVGAATDVQFPTDPTDEYWVKNNYFDNSDIRNAARYPESFATWVKELEKLYYQMLRGAAWFRILLSKKPENISKQTLLKAPEYSKYRVAVAEFLLAIKNHLGL